MLDKININIGDYVSGRYGERGVVVDVEDNKATVDASAAAASRFHRHTNTTGLSKAEKQEFNSIMDDIINHHNPIVKIDLLQKEMNLLHGKSKDRNVLAFLSNEQAKIIRTSNKIPTKFSVSLSSL